MSETRVKDKILKQRFSYCPYLGCRSSVLGTWDTHTHTHTHTYTKSHLTALVFKKGKELMHECIILDV
jgi:hypothetical protein